LISFNSSDIFCEDKIVEDLFEEQVN